MPYQSPVSEIRFILEHLVPFSDVVATDRFSEASEDTVDAILSEAGRISDAVLAPLQRVGDLEHSRLENGVVHTPTGFKEGFAAITEGGWLGMCADPEFGGMGLPQTLAVAVNDMMAGACLSMQLNPLMSQGQIEAMEHHADETLKKLYLPKLISGEWCGTMNLTEPQAGSDVGALRTKAVPRGDGSYAISGQKIFISWGDHDMAENICHLVLARLPDGVPGTKGISLFVVPKFLPEKDGSCGVRNSLRVVSLEEKMGLHASPTAVMEYDEAVGWLVGEPHKGMAAMFTMMNNARLGVGTQAIGAAEGAFQHARAFANERKQGRVGGSGMIIDHPDVRRMLARMKAEIFAARSIILANATAIDMATATNDPSWAARAAFLTPISKAFGTEAAMEIASLGVQVHGGMGYIEETGASQYYRDIRVTAIYEGTNGIQSIDLVGRKMMDGGEMATRLIDEIEEDAEAARDSLPELAEPLWQAAESLRETTEWLLAQEMGERLAGSMAYLKGFARVLGAQAHLRAAAADPKGPRARLARFYIARMLPEVYAHLSEARAGLAGLMAVTVEDLAL